MGPARGGSSKDVAGTRAAGATILPPPSQHGSSPSRPSIGTSSSRTTPKARRRGPVPPGGEGFKDDRARPSTPTRPPPRKDQPATGGPKVSKPLKPLAWHLSAILPATPATPSKRPRSPSPTFATESTTSFPSPKRSKTSTELPPPPPRKPLPPKFDLADCLDVFRPSLLFRSEYEKYGNPTYNQVHGDKRYLKPAPPPVPVPSLPPSWADGDVRALGGALTTSDLLIAPIWARDLVGTGPRDARFGGARMEVVQGIEMYLVGKEYPVRSVALVGVVVAVEDKTTSIIYHLDDSTAVVECSCAVDRPSYSEADEVSSASSGQSGEASSTTNTIEGPRYKSHKLEIGALVRVVGRIGLGRFAGANLSLSVLSIERFDDPNLEAQHHLAVSRLHREIYSLPFDLPAKLALVRQEEQRIERVQKERSSAGTEASTPTPTKRYRLTSARYISSGALTLSNFAVYIKDYLRRHHTSAPSSSSSSPSPLASPSTPPTLDTGRHSSPFTLFSLQQNRTLNEFATRLAQKHARDSPGDSPPAVVPQRKKWERIVSTGSVRGSRKVSAVILPPPGAPKGKGAVKETNVAANLEGDALVKAVHKQFRKALVWMRERGEIVVLASDEVELVDLPPLSSRIAIAADDDATPSTPRAPRTVPSNSPPHQNRPSDFDGPRAPSPPPRPAFLPSPSDRPHLGLFSTSLPTAPRPPPPLLPDQFDSFNSMTATGNEERYQLVTPALLAPLLLRLISSSSSKAKGGLDESTLRELFGRDLEWDAVAMESVVVTQALELLVERGQVVERKGLYMGKVASRGRGCP